MIIKHLNQESSQQNWDGWHILTVAESGFSMLDIFGRMHDLDNENIARFADMVNETNESGSLHPRAPISAVPRKFLRELAEFKDQWIIEEFMRHIAEFMQANERTIRASRILVDLHVSSGPVPLRFVNAIEDAFLRGKPRSIVKEVVIAV